MSFKELLENLNNSNFEVRRAALKKIKVLFENNININEIVENLDLLINNLYQFFKIKPLVDEDVMLDLLLLIFKVSFQ
jgi:hypothetical protein